MIFLVLFGKSSGRLSEPPMRYIKINDAWDFTAQDFVCDIPKDFKRAKMNPDALALMNKIKAFRWKVKANYQVLVLDDCFKCFITGYCACMECCGSTAGITASGTYCHRSDEEHAIFEPSTCAIDMNYFDFGDMFYIPSENRTYIAEDNGAFRGIWIDLYQEEHNPDVVYFDTRYEWIYTCHIETRETTAGIYNVHDFINHNVDLVFQQNERLKNKGGAFK